MRTRTALRVFTVALVLASWFTLTNHCALASLSSETATEGCPMHSQPAPKKKPESAPVCCKTVRAVSGLTSLAKAAPPASLPLLGGNDFAPFVLSRTPQSQPLPVKLDTGPPGLGSFAEVVLQQSLLAHAPPSLG